MDERREWEGYINGLIFAGNLKTGVPRGDEGSRVLNDIRDQIDAEIERAQAKSDSRRTAQTVTSPRNDQQASINIGRVFRLADGSVVRVFSDMTGGMRTLPLGPAHEGMESGTIWPGDVAEYGWEELERMPPSIPMNRVAWCCPQNHTWDDDGIFVAAGDKWLSITVREEQAVDSYNSKIEASIKLNREAAEGLYNAIGVALGR